MNSEYRITWGLVIDVLDVLERHGYHPHDDQHTGQAVLMIGDLVSAYTGHEVPEPVRPAQEADRDTAVLTDADREVGQ